MDHEVGRILDYLDDSGQRDNTFVIFSSDHGSQMYDHGIGNDKHNFYDATFRVPLIMRHPGVLPAGETRGFANLLDTTTSILGAAGVQTVPAQMSGFDLYSALKQGEPSPRLVGIGTQYFGHAVVTPRWKLAYWREQDEGRLYDRVNDPEEQVDLYNDPQHYSVRRGLMRALLRWRSRQDNVRYLQTCSGSANFDVCHENKYPGPEPQPPGGVAPAAKMAFGYTMQMNALQAEIDLQNEALAVELDNSFEWPGDGGGEPLECEQIKGAKCNATPGCRYASEGEGCVADECASNKFSALSEKELAKATKKLAKAWKKVAKAQADVDACWSDDCQVTMGKKLKKNTKKFGKLKDAEAYREFVDC